MQNICGTIQKKFRRIVSEKYALEKMLGSLSSKEIGSVWPRIKRLENLAAEISEIFFREKGIVAREKEKIKEFFGYEIDVPDLPGEITYKKFREWEKLGFALHYLPDEKLSAGRELPGWKEKPGETFYNLITEGLLEPAGDKLPGRWVLIDTIPKPKYIPFKTDYKNDPFEEILEELRNKKIIKDYILKRSRLDISWNELKKNEVRAAFAKKLGVDPDKLRLPRAIEYNYLGNLSYKYWSDTESWEYMDDELQDDKCFTAGSGDFWHIMPEDKNIYSGWNGFRFMVQF